MHVAGLSSGSQHLLRVSNLESIVWPAGIACLTQVNSALHFPSLPWCILYLGIPHNTFCFFHELCINYRFRCSREDCKLQYNNLCKISGAKRVYCGAFQNSQTKVRTTWLWGQFLRGKPCLRWTMISPGGTNRPPLNWCNYVCTVTFVTVFISSSWIDLARAVWENMALI